jgi:hypothetical protein
MPHEDDMPPEMRSVYRVRGMGSSTRIWAPSARSARRYREDTMWCSGASSASHRTADWAWQSADPMEDPRNSSTTSSRVVLARRRECTSARAPRAAPSPEAMVITAYRGRAAGARGADWKVRRDSQGPGRRPSRVVSPSRVPPRPTHATSNRATAARSLGRIWPGPAFPVTCRRALKL